MLRAVKYKKRNEAEKSKSGKSSKVGADGFPKRQGELDTVSACPTRRPTEVLVKMVRAKLCGELVYNKSSQVIDLWSI